MAKKQNNAVTFNAVSTVSAPMTFVSNSEHDYNRSREDVRQSILEAIGSVAKTQTTLNTCARILIVKTFQEFQGKDLKTEMDNIPIIFKDTIYFKPVSAYIRHLNYVCPSQDVIESTDIMMFGRENVAKTQEFGNNIIRERLEKRLKKVNKLRTIADHPKSLDDESTTLTLLLLRLSDIENGKVTLSEDGKTVVVA